MTEASGKSRTVKYTYKGEEWTIHSSSAGYEMFQKKDFKSLDKHCSQLLTNEKELLARYK